MSSFSKLLKIFDCFGDGVSSLTAEEIISKLGCSRPQGYRYIRELYVAGFLSRFSGEYTLGPRVIELDFMIRSADPVLQLAAPSMRELRDRVACDVTFLKMFGDQVVAIHHEKSVNTSLVGFGRGHALPKFRGAGYKVILANLSTYHQKRLFEEYPDDVKHSMLGSGWPDVKETLRQIKNAGYALSLGELDPINVGIAAPVYESEPGLPPFALTLVIPRPRYATSNHELLAVIVKEAAEEITYNLKRRPKG